jgi:type II secretory ATPase GspE/PulE/Tfp pilus assembly ATPase PilB-like protein
MPDNPKLKQLQDAILSGNIPQMVLSTISLALEMRSSDIHIEPEENTIRIRYRVDGVLRQIVEYPHNIHPAVVSRVKIMSNLKIDEQRIPQDGRSTVTTKDGREMDLRISTLPTVRGEKVVMRIQDKSRKIPDLPELGVQGIALRNFEDALALPNGIILTTGPTGSGKTTTMYSALTRLNKIEVNILTIEDPVEIQLDGLNQSQVHPDIEYTFANGLRTALRQDPDIIMVGEIRDRETINIAIEASLTGHLVLSTIHTNSAVETLTRILNMGVPNYLLTSSIEMIMAQRLVRKLCPKCKVPIEPDAEMMELVNGALKYINPQGEIEPELLKKKQFYGPKGCEECDGIGYKGRLGLYEVMRMNNEIRTLINTNAPMMDIERTAMKTGMISLEQIGIIKALKGETSLEEVYRVAKKMEKPVEAEEEEEKNASPKEKAELAPEEKGEGPSKTIESEEKPAQVQKPVPVETADTASAKGSEKK